jgi:hypothetical protein
MKSLSIPPPKKLLTLSIWTNTSVQLRLDWLEVGKKQEVFLCWQYFQGWSAAQSPSQHPKKEPHKSLIGSTTSKLKLAPQDFKPYRPLDQFSFGRSWKQVNKQQLHAMAVLTHQVPGKLQTTVTSKILSHKDNMPPFFTIEYGRGHSDDL